MAQPTRITGTRKEQLFHKEGKLMRILNLFAKKREPEPDKHIPLQFDIQRPMVDLQTIHQACQINSTGGHRFAIHSASPSGVKLVYSAEGNTNPVYCTMPRLQVGYAKVPLIVASMMDYQVTDKLGNPGGNVFEGLFNTLDAVRSRRVRIVSETNLQAMCKHLNQRSDDVFSCGIMEEQGQEFMALSVRQHGQFTTTVKLPVFPCVDGKTRGVSLDLETAINKVHDPKIFQAILDMPEMKQDAVNKVWSPKADVRDRNQGRSRFQGAGLGM